MASSDVKDVLGLGGGAAHGDDPGDGGGVAAQEGVGVGGAVGEEALALAAIQNASLSIAKSSSLKKGSKGASLKKPQGVSREVWELSLKEQVKLGAPIVPVMYTSANANRLKATAASSGAVQIKWNWETFTNSAHADATFQLNHWIRKTPGGLRPSSVNASGDYVFAQYGKKADVFGYNDEEYASLCNTDANWSREATDELLELCETFDLCWPVIADRFTHDKPLEELKARYYEVATALIHARGLATHGTGNVHPIVAQPFNVSHERDRRAGLDVVLSRTPANEREDEALLEQAKAIEERRRREAVASGLAFAEEKSVFYVPPPPKLTSKPPPSASVSALTPSAVAAALAPKSDKMGDATAQAASAAAGGGGGAGGAGRKGAGAAGGSGANAKAPGPGAGATTTGFLVDVVDIPTSDASHPPPAVFARGVRAGEVVEEKVVELEGEIPSARRSVDSFLEEASINPPRVPTRRVAEAYVDLRKSVLEVARLRAAAAAAASSKAAASTKADGGDAGAQRVSKRKRG
ncbi:DNA methyltransferase 1-associated protein 1 [Pycnococcus provasolii]